MRLATLTLLTNKVDSCNELPHDFRRTRAAHHQSVEADTMVPGPLLLRRCLRRPSVSWLQESRLSKLKISTLIVETSRRQVIIRERLRFPSGFSTAVLIGVLHGQTRKAGPDAVSGGFASLVPDQDARSEPLPESGNDRTAIIADPENANLDDQDSGSHQDWANNMRLLLICFGLSGFYTLCCYFLPALRNIPIFGTNAAGIWLWTLNPSPAYIGQGIIMGPETTLHMLLGAVIGWGVLSPLAKYRGWAPGSIDDWETGSKGWIVWVSLAIMLADAIVSLGYIAFRPLAQRLRDGGLQGLWYQVLHQWQRQLGSLQRSNRGYSALDTDEDRDATSTSRLLPNEARNTVVLRRSSVSTTDSSRVDEADAPPEQLISNKVVLVGLISSVLLCITTIHIVFGDLVPLYATVVAVLMALLLSIMGVRALGETDLNPVSGISKLAQLFFALIIPQSHKSSVLINLVAGAVVRYQKMRVFNQWDLLSLLTIVACGPFSLKLYV